MNLALARIGVLVGIAGAVWVDDARAQTNVLAGPVLGWRLGETYTPRLILGVEGGIGWAAERLNVGYERRGLSSAWYLAIEPWYGVGGTLGVIRWSGDKARLMYGVWEGVAYPIDLCDDRRFITTLAVGFRYTGVTEFYVAPKVGTLEGFTCRY